MKEASRNDWPLSHWDRTMNHGAAVRVRISFEINQKTDPIFFTLLEIE